MQNLMCFSKTQKIYLIRRFAQLSELLEPVEYHTETGCVFGSEISSNLLYHCISLYHCLFN